MGPYIATENFTVRTIKSTLSLQTKSRQSVRVGLRDIDLKAGGRLSSATASSSGHYPVLLPGEAEGERQGKGVLVCSVVWEGQKSKER